MPLPAVIGLGALWGAISTVITRIVEWAFTRLGRRFLILTTVIAGIFAALNVLFAFLGNTLNSLAAAAPAIDAIGYALPPVTTQCLSAIISTEIACLVYALTVKPLYWQSKLF